MQKWSQIAGQLTDGGHVLGVRVYYEDTDFTGIVYHGSYVRFFERGRSDFLRCVGIHHQELQNRDDGALAFAVRKLDLEFFKPATIDDLLEVHTSLVAAKGARIVMQQKIFRDSELLVQADLTIAVISSSNRPARLPKEIQDKLVGHLS